MRNELGLADGFVVFEEDLPKHTFWSPEKKPQNVSSSVQANDELRSELLCKAINAITHARHLNDDPSIKKIKPSVIQQIGFDVEEQPQTITPRKLF
jgi:hypothetical protein